MNRDHLKNLSRVVPMTEILALGPAILAGEIRGRIIVDVNQ